MYISTLGLALYNVIEDIKIIIKYTFIAKMVYICYFNFQKIELPFYSISSNVYYKLRFVNI